MDCKTCIVQNLLKTPKASMIMRLYYSLLPTVTVLIITLSHALGEGESRIHCIETEEQALLNFKKGFKSFLSSNPLSSWDPAVDCCKWKGVGCNRTTGHVISLNLRSTNSSDRLSGFLSSSLLELPCLSYLDLSGNDFTQIDVPVFLGSLHNLQHLNLSGTHLRGNLPDYLGNLSHLQSLDLSDNGFSLTAKNLDWLYGLSSMKELDLSEVHLRNAENWLDVINALPFLVVLRLSACQLPKLPSYLLVPIVNFTSLQILDLSLNGFHGAVPNWLFEIEHLRYLDLSDNELFGQIPDKFENLESLVFLDLSNNNLSGPIPSTLGQTHSQNELVRQSSLKGLLLSDNHLCGSLAERLVRFSDLEVLDVSRNEFEGILMDSHLDNLRSLMVLDLSSNHLRLNVSKFWIPPFQLERIGLRSVQIGPRFPSWLQSQKNCLYFDVSNANITSSVPNWFWHLSPKVEFMNLSHNNFRGCVHDFSLNLNLHTLDLRKNNFRCPLPHFPPAIRTLNLAKNSFYGPMSHVCDILGVNNSLLCLDLSSNNLSGNIPNCWERGENLIVLSLKNNDLSGHIPISLQKCTTLSYLSLSENGLSGEIPTWIGDSLQQLVILDLHSNVLEGDIPMQLCQLKLLMILDLSGNHLSGAIPRCVFTAMATSDLRPTGLFDSYTTYKGSLSDLFLAYGNSQINSNLHNINLDCNDKIGFLCLQNSICKQYVASCVSIRKTLDLSSNSLTGVIPKEITRHVGLLLLNLSRNQLVGSIPSEIGNMENMEALDLSRNRLSCSIPSSMINLSFLYFFDVSYNNLAGKIPSRNQFPLFESDSYVGNENLCGPPLASCSTNESLEDQNCEHSEEHEEIGEHEGQEDDSLNWLGTPSFYISVVLGFITGFWAFWSPLILSASWRHSYFRFLDHMNDKLYVTIAVAAAKLQGTYLSQ